MTIHEKAAKIISYARFLSLEDATEIIRLELELIRNEGIRAGIEDARQTLSQLEPAE